MLFALVKARCGARSGKPWAFFPQHLSLRKTDKKRSPFIPAEVGSGEIWLPHSAQLLFRFLYLLSVAPTSTAHVVLRDEPQRGTTALPSMGTRSLHGCCRANPGAHRGGGPLLCPPRTRKLLG